MKKSGKNSGDPEKPELKTDNGLEKEKKHAKNEYKNIGQKLKSKQLKKSGP